MFLWIAAGYVLSAIAFYSYIVTTVAETTDRQWARDQNNRKAA